MKKYNIYNINLGKEYILASTYSLDNARKKIKELMKNDKKFYMWDNMPRYDIEETHESMKIRRRF